MLHPTLRLPALHVLFSLYDQILYAFLNYQSTSITAEFIFLDLTWEWRKLHNEELNDLYSSCDVCVMYVYEMCILKSCEFWTFNGNDMHRM